MLETIVARQIIFYVVGAVAAIGIIAKLVAGISLKRLVRASSNMNKSNHALMRLVRAKFEHACMVSDKVQNVRAFVEKYVYEYRVIGLRLHSWRQLEKATIWIYGIVSAAGAGLEYYVNGPGETMYQYAIVGAAGVVVLFLLHITTDERYQIEAAKVYMVDFLENTYAHRYEKPNQKEIQVTVQKAEEEKAAGHAGFRQPAMAQKENVPAQEPDIRPVTPMEEPGTSTQNSPVNPGIDPGQPQKAPEQPMQQPVQPARAPMQGRQPAAEAGDRSSIHGRTPLREQPVQMKVRLQEEKQPELEAQAVASPYVQTAGEPRNASVYAEPGNASPGVQNASGMHGYQAAEPEAQSSYGQVKEESSMQDFPKEAKIREILEEFLA